MRTKDKFLNILFLVLPFLTIILFNLKFLFSLYNPSWGDMVALPTFRLPFENAFYIWNSHYSSGLGITYFPYILLSQFKPFIPNVLLVFVYLYFIFIPIHISFVCFFKDNLNKKSFLDRQVIVTASILTLTIYFSNVFLTNFLQGSVDVYFSYLIAIPILLHYYLAVKNNSLLQILVVSLWGTVATYYGSLASIYIIILSFPVVILLLIYFRKKIKSVLLLTSVAAFFIFCNTLPINYQSFLSVTNAVRNSTNSVQQDSLFGEMKYMYQNISPLNLFVFSGNSGDISRYLFDVPHGYIAENNVFFYFLSFQLTIILGVLLYIKVKDKNVNFSDMNFVIALLGIFSLYFLLIITWHNGTFLKLVHDIPLVPLYRNPKKLILSLFVIFILILVFLRKIVGQKQYLGIITFILLLNFFSVFPLVTDGYNGLKKSLIMSRIYDKQPLNNIDDYFRLDKDYPQQYIHLETLLKTSDKEDSKTKYKIIVVPDNSQSLNQNYLRYIFDPFYLNSANAVWGDEKNSTDFQLLLYKRIIDNTPDDFTNFLKMANVKYIVIDRKSPYYFWTDEKKPQIRFYYGVYTLGDPVQFEKILDKKNGIKKIYKDKNFIIYTNETFIPSLLYIPEHVCTTDDILKVQLNCDFYAQDAYTNEIYKNASKVQFLGYEEINPTKFILHMNVTEPTDVVVFFGEIYNTHWNVAVPNGLASEHEVGNSFGNSWKIHFDKPGKQDVSISFDLQNINYKFTILAFVTVVLNIFLLIGIYIWNKTHEK
jgi:hypothetical protein